MSGKIGYEELTMSDRSKSLAADPLRGRLPTSHERLSGRPWDASYHDGPPPWDIGHPQPVVVRLASEGRFAGAVLDAGCGTGENALHIALHPALHTASLGLSSRELSSPGFSVLGVDVAETALAIARQKAAARGIEAEFAAADALQLQRLERTFDTVLDCGLFHTFDGLNKRTEDDRTQAERTQYVSSLASVTRHNGILYVLCFSDGVPDTGPHPVSEQDLRAAFNPRHGWNVAALQPDRIKTTFHDDHGAPAWLVTIKRL
ncbi:MAG: class I SAM-dependent methyltransferase [Terriglobales bacterium]